MMMRVDAQCSVQVKTARSASSALHKSSASHYQPTFLSAPFSGRIPYLQHKVMISISCFSPFRFPTILLPLLEGYFPMCQSH